MTMPMLRSVPAVAIACGALFLAASGGAVAGSMITGKQIKDGTVTTKDVKNKTLKAQDLSPAAIAALKGATGPVGPAGAKGDQGVPGPKGDQGVPGTARAYAWIKADGTVERSSGNVTATVASSGYTCVAVAGISSSTTAFVVSPDYSLDGTSSANQTYAEAASNNAGCPGAGDFGVITFVRNAGSGTRTDTTQPFFIVIP